VKGIKDISEVSTKNTFLITYKNPYNEDAVPAEVCFTGKEEIIQGINLGVRLGLKMTFFATDEDVFKFATEYLNHYTT